MAGAVPIYLGAPNIAEYAPGPRSFINARDFATGQDLWGYLQRFMDGDADADDAYASFFSWKTGANMAFDEDERGLRYAVGTGQALPRMWPKPKADIARDAMRWPRPVVGGTSEELVATGSDPEFRDASKWSWRIFRERLDNCVHYAECRLCEYVHAHS